MDSISETTRRRRGLAVLVAGTVLLFGIALGARDLWNPNEPTYGRVVVEMIESGDWLLPTINGSPFVEKPVLYYWLAAGASLALGGVSEATLRAPLMFNGVLGVLLVYLLIEAYDGRRRALVGGALFATLYSVWFTARNVQMDSFVLVGTLAVVLALTRRLDHDWSGKKAWLIAGTAAGLAFAAKGPVTVVLCGLIVGSYLLVGRRPWRRLLPGLPLGILAFAIFALPWYTALFLAGRTEALHELLFRQNVSRFLSAWDHQQPWWYYLKYFWLTFAPWSWFVPIAGLAVLKGSGDGPEETLGNKLAWAWLLAPLIFFSLSDSKREPYMLPTAPAVAWIGARLFDRLYRGDLRPGLARACTGVSSLLGSLLLLAGVYLGWAKSAEAIEAGLSPALTSTVFILCGAMMLAASAVRPMRHVTPLAVGVSFAVLYLFIATYLHPAANAFKSHRPLVRDLEAHLPAGSTLYSYLGGQRLIRGGYPFYLGHNVPDLVDEAQLRATWTSHAHPCVIYEEPAYEGLIEGLDAAERLFEGNVGSTTVRLVCAVPRRTGPVRLAASP
jgi:4-amino-4-deoxy-L-arabinose transferase-like glycosyltransferase